MSELGNTAIKDLRRKVATMMAAAIGVSIAILALAYVAGEWRALDERLAIAATASMVAAGWLAAAIGRVAWLRILAPFGADHRIADTQRMVRDTLEQVVLAIPAYFAAAAMIEHGNGVIAAAVALFSIGRMMFWSGTAHAPAMHALAFALTFFPTLVLIAALIVRQALRVLS